MRARLAHWWRDSCEPPAGRGPSPWSCPVCGQRWDWVEQTDPVPDSRPGEWIERRGGGSYVDAPADDVA